VIYAPAMAAADDERAPFLVREVAWRDARERLLAVRVPVFVDEQGVPPEIEEDEDDPRCVHVLAEDRAGRPIGTGRLLPDGKIGRMAVVRAWRGRGVGAALLRALLERAAHLGTRPHLSAQVAAVGFDERFGFVPEGDVYEEAGIPHRRMRLGR